MARPGIQTAQGEAEPRQGSNTAGEPQAEPQAPEGLQRPGWAVVPSPLSGSSWNWDGLFSGHREGRKAALCSIPPRGADRGVCVAQQPELGAAEPEAPH